MPMTDVWGSDAFSLVSLTESINQLPYKPGRIGEMKLFSEKGITTTTAIIEEKRGVLSLLPTARRGAPATEGTRGSRKARSFVIPHIPYEDRILPEDVQGVRKFGSESDLESIASVVNDRLQDMRQSHEVTLEHLRVGAIKGKILDADGSTELFNLFTEFNITEPTAVDFELDVDTTQVGEKIVGIKRTIEDALGAVPYDHIHCFCGSDFWDSFIEHPEVKYAYQYFQDGEVLRGDLRTAGFKYKGVIFEEYRGSIGSVSFIPAADARFFPVGVPNLFVTYFAPADFMETSNQIGLPVYAKQQLEEFGRGVKLHTQSNPLPLCTRPGVLVRGYRY